MKIVVMRSSRRWRRGRRRVCSSTFLNPITARRRGLSRNVILPSTSRLPERLDGRKVAVVAGSAHEAYLKVHFHGS